MAKRVNYEARFYVALKRITAYMTPAQLRRAADKQYGLDHAEALEMAYENVIGEAKLALRGYRPARPDATKKERTTDDPVGATSHPEGEVGNV